MSESSEPTWIPGLRRDGNTGMSSSGLAGCKTATDNLSNRRGKSGGQVRDEYREEYDPGRGGYGRAYDEQRQREEEQYGEGR